LSQLANRQFFDPFHHDCINNFPKVSFKENFQRIKVLKLLHSKNVNEDERLARSGGENFPDG